MGKGGLPKETERDRVSLWTPSADGVLWTLHWCVPQSPGVVDDLVTRNLLWIGNREGREGTGLAFGFDVLEIPFSIEERWPHFLETKRFRLDDVWIDSALVRGNWQRGFPTLWVLSSTSVRIHHSPTRELSINLQFGASVWRR